MSGNLIWICFFHFVLICKAREFWTVIYEVRVLHLEAVPLIVCRAYFLIIFRYAVVCPCPCYQLLTPSWYILCTAFSTTQALTDWSSVFYSVIYTSVPTIVVGILDKDLSHKTLLEHPKLYGAGHRQESYNLQLFWITMLDTLWQSLVLFYVPLYTYFESTLDIWSLGSLWTISVVILVNMHLAMDIQRWVFITHAAVWGSIIITCVCMVVLDSIPVFPNYWTIYHLAVTPTYWLTIALILIVALLPRFLCKAVYQMFWPSDVQIAREAEKMSKQKKLDAKTEHAS